jgi:hypothetical protein
MSEQTSSSSSSSSSTLDAGSTPHPKARPNTDDHAYHAHASVISARAAAAISTNPVFTTTAVNLFDIYLNATNPAKRQESTCSTCRHFFNTYGGLVTIDPVTGLTTSLLWDGPTDPAYAKQAAALSRAVKTAEVTGPFLWSDPNWGSKVDEDGFHHYYVEAGCVSTFSRLKTAAQAMADKREDFKNVARGIAEWDIDVVEAALNLLKTGRLHRSDRVMAPVQWLRNLKVAMTATKHAEARKNLIWRAVTTAPDGFCHPRTAVTASLLDDIRAGMPFHQVEAKFAHKMQGDLYQRPQAPAKSGNIEQAEQVVAKLGIANSLKRRFARFEEVTCIWTPRERRDDNETATGGAPGVFDVLKAEAKKAASPYNMAAPSVTMTFEKFRRTVLPTADSIEFSLPVHGSYGAFTTAEDSTAPPILQWDKEDARNPVAVYVYSSGSAAADWSLKLGRVKVQGIAMKPWMWGQGETDNPYAHQGRGFCLILDGAKDTRAPGLALFPETLKSDLHGIRSTIERFASISKLSGVEEATACGWFQAEGKSGQPWSKLALYVTSNGVTSGYLLDRWD